MNYVFTLDQSRLPELLEYYKEYDASRDNPNAIVVFRSPEVTVTVYKSLKVMIQGPEARDEYLMWADLLEFEPQEEAPASLAATPEKIAEVRSVYYLSSSIGSDEVGTGDFFGPVVVCAAFVAKSMIARLEGLKVRDSKKMTDEAILAVAPSLISLLPHAVLVVDDPKYNDLVKQGYNLNKMKAYLHNHAIRKCLQKTPSAPDYVIVDEFCPKDQYYDYLKDVEAYRKVTFLQKGESAHLAVAAASVIARYTFLQEMEKLNQKIGLLLPLGASPIVDLVGKRIALEKGFDLFPEIAKVNFKNMEKIRAMTKTASGPLTPGSR